MAWPSTGILDNFNRADDTTPPPGANWQGDILLIAEPGFVLQTNQLNTGGANASMYWQLAKYGPDCESYVTVVSLPAFNGDTAEVFARFDPGIGGGVTGYSFVYTRGSTAANSTWKLVRWDAGPSTQIGSTFTGAMTAGDEIGMSCQGTTIIGYQNLTARVTTTDSNYSLSNYIGMRSVDTLGGGQTFDDFGGGTMVTGPVTPDPIGLPVRHIHFGPF